MPEWFNGRMMEPSRLLLGAFLAVGALACASTLAEPEGAGSTLQDVRVERDGDATVVQLVGVEGPVFTAYRQQDPERLTVDLASVQPAELRDPLAVYDGLVEEISVSPFSQGTGEGSTRVELTLAAMADYVVEPAAGGLAIRVSPVAGMAAVPRLEAEDLSTQVSAEADTALAATAAAPATRLVAVDVKKMAGGVVLEMRADGAIESAGSFTLESPDRLVIDLPGLVSAVDREKIAVGTPQAKQLRIGQHDGMVRVVVDGGAEAKGFDGRRVVPVGDGLVVALGSGAAFDVALDEMLGGSPWTKQPAQEVAAARAAASAVPAAPAPSGSWTELATVQGVEFDTQAERDRITVVADRPLEYVVHQPDAETVVVSVPGARLQPQLDPRIAPEPGGPVSLVTAFEQPEMAVPEVRIVVERAAGLEPEVTRQGSLMIIEFPRKGGVAATPPVVAKAPSGADATAAAMPMASTAPASIAPAGAMLAKPSGPPVVPAGVAAPASLEPPAAISLLQEGGLSESKQYTGRRISLDFKDIEMADVLRLVADVSDLNVIAGDEVKGKVTIRLVDVPWDQALDVILLTKGLGFMRIGNVLRIAPADLLKKEEEARLQERRAIEQLEDLVVKLQPVNYATAQDVQGMVKQLLTPRGTVQTDKRTNTLIIKDIPSVVDEATALVKAVDTQTPQVMIEAKIVEASLDFSREFGVVWGFGVQPLNDPFDASSGLRQPGGSLWTTNTSAANNAQFINPLTAGPTALFSIAGYVLDEKLNLNLQLQAAEVNGDGKVISSPRLVTLDNNKATIEQGVSIPFQTFENGDAQLEFVDAVLKLDVTPHITADRSIIMKIVVSRNAPDDSVFTLTGSPAIAKNQVNTETLVKDGQTLVIGGIYVVDKSERQSSVPYLGDIPMLGALFRNNEISDSRKELLIFVTPRVVQQPQGAS
jgi:type IV pilus assembly protein PilQ